MMLALLLLAAALAAPAAEIPLSEPVFGPAAFPQFTPVVASDGDGYLALWHDGRGGAHTDQLRATRIAASGEVLDPLGIRLPAMDTSRAEMIWTGDSYLVIGGPSLSTMRLDRDGNLIEGPREVLAGATLWSAISNGTMIVAGVVIGDAPYAVFLTRSGEVLSTVRLAQTSFGVAPRLVWTGTAFVAVWMGSPTHLEAVRFDGTSLIDSQPHAIVNASEDIIDPQLASDGSGLFVILSHVATNPYLVARRVSADLATVTAPVQLPGTWSDGTIRWMGSEYLVTGLSGWWALTMRLDREGNPLESTPTALDHDVAAFGDVATNGRDVYYAWVGHERDDAGQPRNPNVYGAIKGGERRVLTVSARNQSRAFVASSGSDLLALWHESGRTFARRFTTAGAPIGVAIEVPELYFATALIFDGSDYLAAGVSNTFDYLLVRPVSGEVVQRFESLLPLALGTNGTEAIVATGDGAELVLTRLSDGARVEVADNPRGAAISWNGAELLVVWSEGWPAMFGHGGDSQRRIRAARLSPDLAIRGVIDVSSGAYDDDPAVAWNGDRWLVIWKTLDNELRGRELSRDGSLSTERTIVTNAMRPSLVWDGTRFVLGWTGTAFPWTLRTAALPTLGAPLVGGREVGFGVFDDFRVSFAPLGRGIVAAAYTRRADETSYGGVPRSFLSISTPPVVRRRAVR